MIHLLQAMVQCVSSSQPDSGSPSSIDPQHFQPHLTTLEYTDQGKTLITEKRGKFRHMNRYNQ